MSERGPQTFTAVRELLDAMGALPDQMLAGERAVPDDDVLDVARWLFSITWVGLQAFVWADPARPRFVDIVGPTMKWGGDNTHAFYQHATVDPARAYVVRADPGDAVYWSLTVYGGPRDGHYSERIVGSVNDREAARAPDGSVSIALSPEPPPEPGRAWIRLEPDAVCAITRDYLDDPVAGRRMRWWIEAIDSGPPEPLTDAALAARFGAATTWLRDQAQIVPVLLDEANTVLDPYPVPQQTFGWAAGDAAYAMGAFDLGPDDVLLIEGRSPACAFWNLCLWNHLLHTFADAGDRVSIAGADVELEADGSWRIAVGARDPGLPNWVSTHGRRRGLLWFRWFLPERTPDRPECTLIRLP